MARSKYVKAYVGALSGAVFGAAVAAIPLLDNGLTGSEVLIILCAFLTGGGFVGGSVYASPKNATGDAVREQRLERVREINQRTHPS